MFGSPFASRASVRRRGTHARYESAKAALGRLQHEPLEDRAMLSLSPWSATATGDMRAVREAAEVAYHGVDLTGKDGPLASIGFDLALLGEEFRMHQQRHPGTPFVTSSPLPIMVSGNSVRVDVSGSGDMAAFQTQLAGIGMTNMSRYGTVVSGSLPIVKLPQLAALDSLRVARPAYKPFVSAGTVTSQADGALRADEARTLFGIDGTGVTVGVLSDSFNALGGMSADIASDDLPADTQILVDLPGGSDEGRAMAQLIHDLAPGAAIRFATAVGGEAAFAQNIVQLANVGSDVIVDDVIYFAEPFFQDGVVAQAARSVTLRGIPYFSSAGNSGDTSYESGFVDSGEDGDRNGALHDFDPGPEVATTQQITVPQGDEFIISFQWDQAFASLGGPGATSDLDIAILGSDGTVIANGITANVGGDPLEVISIINDGSFDFDNDDTPDTTFFVRIELVSGNAPALIKYVAFTNSGTIDTFDTNSATSYGHANTAGVMGVAASAFLLTPEFGTTPPMVNDFSSKGGIPLLFDTAGNRLTVPFNPNSPQITGVDGTNTTFFGNDISQDADTFPNFFGTSAAAPHVAAVAALMIDLTGGPGVLPVEVLYEALTSTAIDIVSRFDLNTLAPIPIPNGAGFDAYSGFGLIDAVEAMQTLVGVALGSDVSVIEGDSGTVDAVFTVSVNFAAAETVTVLFTTVDVTATAGIDYEAQSGALTFLPGGPLTQTIIIKVQGDEDVEPNETFLVQLTSASGAGIIRGTAVGTILNDDQDLSINDITLVEGHTGTRNAVFTVTAFGVVPFTTTVQYSTVDGDATAPADYLPRVGALTFAPGVAAALVTVPVLGDTLNEGAHSFFVLLHSAVGARIVDGMGLATIIDDDPLPSLYVNDVQITTTSAGRLAAVFTVGLDTASGRNVHVVYGTSDGGAIAGTDYLGSVGTLTFQPGVTALHVTVPVMTEAEFSPNKKFYLNLSSPANALVADGLGVCTVVYAEGPLDETIIDNGDPGYSRSFSGWTTASNTLAYQTDYDYAAAGSGSSYVTWTFANIAEGPYQVLTRWVPFANRATNAPYTVFDGAAALATVPVNQQLAPASNQSNGIAWHSLGTFLVTSRTLVVRLANNANGYVLADAVRIVAGGVGPAAPEIDVSGSGLSIEPADVMPSVLDGTDFGEVNELNGSTTRTFTIANHGGAPLHLTGSPAVTISGAGDFTVVSQPAKTLAPGAQTTFTIAFDPAALGERTATVSIASDDANESPYVFMIRGKGMGPPPDAFFIDDGAVGYTQLGAWTSSSEAAAYQGQLRRSAAGDGSGKAIWDFSGLTSGFYQVFTTWAPSPTHATNAPFTVSNLAGSDVTLFVNQRNAPTIPFAGTVWGSLGIVEASAGMVRVSLSNNANGPVAADAVVLVRFGAPLPNGPQPPAPDPPAPEPPVVSLTHNAAFPQDVNHDNRVTPHDSLLIINRILATTTASAVPLAATSGSGPVYYTDVNNDGRVTPHDVLMVFNYMLRGFSSSTSAGPLVAEDTAGLSAVAVDLAIGELAAPDAEKPPRTEAAAPAAEASKPATEPLAALALVDWIPPGEDEADDESDLPWATIDLGTRRWRDW